MKSSLVFVVALAGCGISELDPSGLEEGDGDSLGEAQQGLIDGNCTAWMCGMNSPLIDNYDFHDFNLAHIVNPEGFKYDSFTISNVPYTLRVINGRISALSGQGIILYGSSLVGGYIHISNGNTNFFIRISAVAWTPYWAVRDFQRYRETYVLDWTVNTYGKPGRFKNVCSNPATDEQLLDMNSHHSLVFEGERINAKSKTIALADSSWVNIGCAGSTLAKLDLTGHTLAAQSQGFYTTIEERQTLLKMVSADYCGTGTPYTVAGIPLTWADDKGWMHVAGQPAGHQPNLEARWGADGAACLRKPRLTVNPTIASVAQFGPPDQMWDLIKHECPLIKECPDESLVPAPDHLISAHP